MKRGSQLVDLKQRMELKVGKVSFLLGVELLF